MATPNDKNGTDGSRKVERLVRLSLFQAATAQAATMTNEHQRLAVAIREAVDSFNSISWGWDGDCGSQEIIDILEEAIEPNALREPPCSQTTDQKSAISG